MFGNGVLKESDTYNGHIGGADDTGVSTPAISKAVGQPTRDRVAMRRGGRGKDANAGIDVRLTVQRLTRAAKALVATAARHAACPHLKRATQAA